MYTIRCEHCGREFLADRSYTKYCSYECKKAVQNERRKEYNKKHKKNKKADKTDKGRTSLTDINHIAREAGMSYGQYVAQQYIENMRRRA